MKNEKPRGSSDINLLEEKIENKIEEIYSTNNLNKIKEIKKEIEEAVTKKSKISGELSAAGSYIKKLIDERAGYENTLNSGSEDIKAPVSGLVSYKIDGLEETLSYKNFYNITNQLLNDLNLKTGQLIETSNESGKIVNNFKFYIAIVMESEKAKEAKVGDSVLLRISSKKEINTKITHINEEDSGKRVIIFETDSFLEELINYRKVSVDVIWWSYTGLKIPNSAIIKENELAYVIRNRAGYTDKILIKVLWQNENYSLVRKYKTEELKELGYTDKEIINMKNIALYDEILINSQ